MVVTVTAIAVVNVIPDSVWSARLVKLIRLVVLTGLPSSTSSPKLSIVFRPRPFIIHPLLHLTYPSSQRPPTIALLSSLFRGSWEE